MCFSRTCDNLLSPGDKHTRCMFCLGLEHARQAFENPGFCPCCLYFSDREKGRRISRVNSHQDRSLAGTSDLRARLSRPAPDIEWPALPPPRGRPLPRPGASSTVSRPPDLGAVPRRRPESYRDSSPARKAPRTVSYRPARPLGSYAASSRSDDDYSFLDRYSRDDRWDDSRYSGADSPEVDRYVPPHGDLPPLFHEGRDWGGVMDDDRPIDDLPSFQEPVDDYRVLDIVGYNDDDLSDAADVQEPQDEDAPPREVLAIGDHLLPDDPPAVAAVAEADAAAGAAPDLPTDDRELVDLFHQASVRCNRPWPEEAPPPSKEEEFYGLKSKKPNRKIILPLAQGFKAYYTACWNKPSVTPSTPRRSRVPIDVVDMPSLCLDNLPKIDRTVGAFLLNPTPHITPLTHDPVFPVKRDKDASAANGKHYDLIVAAAKHLNASALIQGSQTALLHEMGNNSTPEQLAEVRRLHEEIVTFTCCLTDLLGRMATSAIMAERARWLDVSRNLDPDARKELSEGAIIPGGLFKGALERLALSVEVQRPGCEALAAFVPRSVRPRAQGRSQGQPPRQPPRPPPGQQRPTVRAARQTPRPRLDRDVADRDPGPAPPADRDGRRRRPGDQRRRPPPPQAGPRKGAPRPGKDRQGK